MWIHNKELRECTRIPKGEPIPEGWCKGRIMDFDLEDKKEKKSEEKKLATLEKQQKQREKTKQYYTDLYEIYKNNSFKEFCRITGYERTQQNLCTNFKKYVDNYEPKVITKK